VRRLISEVLSVVVPALILAYLLQAFVVQTWIIDGPSMETTLWNGERVFINRFIYRFSAPKRGDIVVFHLPQRGDRDFVKRVIGLPGETIEIRLGRVYINQQPIDEPYIKRNALGDFPKTVIPPGQVFVMGDNRGNSHDSRAFGSVPVTLIRGKVFLVYWPLGHVRLIR